MPTLLVFALLLLGVGSALADERIIAFHSDVQINDDASLSVTETIEVEAEGGEIQRGILRDFPTDYRDRLGNRVTVPFEVESVRRDGAPENWASENLDNGVRVRIGRAEVMLPYGRHTYEIRYRTARQLGFFDDHDELYWNVTGNGWTLAMDRASARVQLPHVVAADHLSADAYTGEQGAQGNDWRARVIDGGAEYETTQPLRPGEGLTIVLTFPKGLVKPPSTIDRMRWFVAANRAAGLGGIGVIAVFGWLYARWRSVGRDPRAGPLFPRYEPPAGISAGAARFLSRMRFDSRCFAAGLLGLGARGYLKIDQQGARFELQTTGADIKWLPGERQLVRVLFAAGDRAAITTTYDPLVEAAQKAFEAELRHKYDDVLFSRNAGSMGFGVLLAAITVGSCMALDATGAVLFPVILLLAAMLAGFLRWMPSYTVQGRKLQDEIEGLRQYLGVAERDSLARMKAPELTPQEFARMLPFALALDVEKTWADRFAAVAGSAAVAAAVAGYYHSNNYGSGFDLGGALGKSLGDLGNTASAASSPPGSNSGSGGGGSSGGGGGGGGGSGW